jgi:hypothetical protein
MFHDIVNILGVVTKLRNGRQINPFSTPGRPAAEHNGLLGTKTLSSKEKQLERGNLALAYT